jgi:hypothetical protein
MNHRCLFSKHPSSVKDDADISYRKMSSPEAYPGRDAAETNLVAVVPERLTRNVAGLMTVEPPVDVAGFEMLMLRHEQQHRDAGHR